MWRGGGLVLACLLLTGCDMRAAVSVPAAPLAANAPCASTVVGGAFPTAPAMSKTAAQIGIRTFVCHDGYALLYDTWLHDPIWVAQWLDPAFIEHGTPAVPVPDDRPDPEVGGGQQSTLTYYVDVPEYQPVSIASPLFGVHRRAAWSQAFYFTNMGAMTHAAQQTWRRINANVMAWAKSRGGIAVIAGPLFSTHPPQRWAGPRNVTVPRHFTHYSANEIETNKMAIPDGYYCVVLDPRRDQGLAFTLDNDAQGSLHVTSIGAIEQATGIVFWPNEPAWNAVGLNLSAWPWRPTLKWRDLAPRATLAR